MALPRIHNEEFCGWHRCDLVERLLEYVGRVKFRHQTCSSAHFGAIALRITRIHVQQLAVLLGSRRRKPFEKYRNRAVGGRRRNRLAKGQEGAHQGPQNAIGPFPRCVWHHVVDVPATVRQRRTKAEGKVRKKCRLEDLMSDGETGPTLWMSRRYP